MRFTCEKNTLLTGLNITGRTVAQKSAISAIEGILCKAGDGLSLTGYNMETAITYLIEAEVSDMGQCVLPARLFGDIIRRLPEGPGHPAREARRRPGDRPALCGRRPDRIYPNGQPP